MAELEVRLSKIDDAIQRLAQVSADLSKMLAVHEQRLMQYEKESDLLTKLIENRRLETESKIDDIYNSFRSEDRQIIEELKKSREAATKQHEEQNSKIARIEKLIWMVSGGAATLGYVTNMILSYYKVFH